jgi:hypothetical protein
MADPDSAGSSSPFFSLNAVLAVVTLVGGLVLMPHQLSSQRPAVGEVEGTRPLGDQNIESRLWEDPFAAWDKLKPEEQGWRREARLTNLVEVLTNADVSARPTNALVLGIMVSGQPYAEDKESRIRARYAVGAALGSDGYKPVTADHIGLVASAWPNSRELSDWMAGTNAQLGIQWDANDDRQSFCPALDTNLCLRVPFEVYEPREYRSADQNVSNSVNASASGRCYDRVLLVWLDEEYFDDKPVPRLALLLNQLQTLVGKNDTNPPQYAIVGPRLSSTLQALLASGAELTHHPQLQAGISNSLAATRLILASPSAMDEVLVDAGAVSNSAYFDVPRRALAAYSHTAGLFQSVTNCVCTDNQMAHAVLAELKLRNLNPADTNQHVVLISEWDTFFARMSSLAFAAEMLGCTNGAGRLAFVEAVRRQTNAWPANLHRYVYLQGLDGETADVKKPQAGKRTPSIPGSADNLEDLLNDAGDFNKAEGPPQFDYLTRLGDVLAGFDCRVRLANPRGRIVAVGIIGLDLYDKLLILQALRDRLPNAIFFTTVLDARLWEPDDLDWSRNLLVFSSYGLRLNETLQGEVAPFRDSEQSQAYLATLSALKSDKVGNFGLIPPRRFEIGRYGPVEMRPDTNEFWADPRPAPAPAAIWFPLTVALAILLGLNSVIWRAVRRVVFPSLQYQCEPLRVAAEDIGRPGRAPEILRELVRQARDDDFARWILRRLFQPGLQPELEFPPPGAWAYALRARLIETGNLLVFMTNPVPAPVGQPCLIGRKELPDDDAIERTGLLDAPAKTGLLKSLAKISRRAPLVAADIRANRQALNLALDRLNGPNPPEATCASTARAIALLIHQRRRWLPAWFWATAALLGAVFGSLGWFAWRDTWLLAGGEPFNLAGTSAWPAEFIRVGVLLFSVLVIVKIQRKMESTNWEITRKYRFHLPPNRRPPPRPPWHDWPAWPAWLKLRFWRIHLPEAPTIGPRVQANMLWQDYHRTWSASSRALIVLVPVVFYFFFGFSLSRLSGDAFSPIRGDFLCRWDYPLLILTILALVTVTFWIIEVSRCCAWFIRRLSQASTRYPHTTLEHFKRQYAIDDDALVEEWVDLQLTADLTEPIGKLIYWPFLAVMLLVVARMHWWDHWTWPWPLMVIFALNLALAATGSIYLRLTAMNIRREALKNFETKVNLKKRMAARSLPEHEADQAEALLAEIKNLRRGAFAPLAQNPLVGAILMNSSSLVVLQLLAQHLSK